MNQTSTSPLLVRHTAAGETFLTVTLDSKNILISEWRGFVTPAQIESALLETLELQVRHQVKRVLNDLTHVTGTWSQAIPWIAGEFQTLMRQRLTESRGALVLGASVFSNLSAKQMIVAFEQDAQFQTELFPSREPALAWLSR